MPDFDPTTPLPTASAEATPAVPRQRRPRYAGKNPRRFEQKYKELNPDRYAADVAKVIASGKTPAGSHRPKSEGVRPSIIELWLAETAHPA